MTVGVGFDQLLRGVVQVLEHDGAVFPRRFSPLQLQEYGRNATYAARSVCAAGVRIVFQTNAHSLQLIYGLKATVRGWAFWDVFVNGEFVQSTNLGHAPGVYCLELTPAETEQLVEVEIYLPHSAEIVLRELRIDKGAVLIPAPARPKTLLCLGDSITQGMDGKRPSLIYPAQVGRFLGMEVLNQGIGGYVFSAASLTDDLELNPDLITVAYGTNDWGYFQSMLEFEGACSQYLERVRQLFPSVPLFVLTPLWRADKEQVKALGRLADVQDTIARIGRGLSGVTVIDGMALAPHLPAFFGDEYLHPSDEGFCLISLGLCNRLRGENNYEKSS